MNQGLMLISKTEVVCNVWVPGEAATKGSMHFVKSKHTGKPIPKQQGSKNLSEWTHAVKAAVWQYVRTKRARSGGFRVILLYHFPRFRNHYRTGQYSAELRPDAPRVHDQKPDPDKLARAVLDALTGIVWKDDKQVYDLRVKKKWVDRFCSPGMWLRITR